MLRVQVKTSTYSRGGRYEVTLCTRGGNRSWSGATKYFSQDRCDALLVTVGDGRRWFLPSSVVPGGVGIVLGGPKYACYEVDRGTALRASGRGSEATLPSHFLAGCPSG